MVGFLGMTGKALSIAQIALVVAPSFILFGYNQSGLGSLLTEENWSHTFPLIDTIHFKGATKSHHATLQGVIVATFVLGALVGALSCSYTGDRLGRRWIIFLGALCTLIGEAIECSAFGLAQLIVGRVIIGLGIGQLSATVPVWQSECSSAKNRGKHVVLDGMFISFGYTLESWIDFGFFTLKTGSVTWRPPIAIALLFSLIVLGSIWFFPESPRWLLRKNRGQEARDNLAALKGLPVDSPEIEVSFFPFTQTENHILTIIRPNVLVLNFLLKILPSKAHLSRICSAWARTSSPTASVSAFFSSFSSKCLEPTSSPFMPPPFSKKVSA